MSEVLTQVLKTVEKTGSWYGIEITSLSQRNDMGDTPLHTACSWGQEAPVRTLVEAGADVNARGDKDATPLFNAIIGRNVKVVALLIASGADVTLKVSWGRTPRQYAESIGASKDVIELL